MTYATTPIYNFPLLQQAGATRVITWSCTDSFATVTAAGYVNPVVALDHPVFPNDVFLITYNSASAPLTAYFSASTNMSNGHITLAPTFIGNNSGAGQTVSLANTSTAPGTIRALTGTMTSSATTVSGNLVGVRGALTVASSSGAYLYGVQGKVVATGTISNSGGGFEAGVLGQFDMSAATLSSTSYMAPIWSDFGSTATSGTYAQTFLYSGTNSTAAILGAQINLYGGATALMALTDNNALVGATYFKAAGTTSGSWGNTPVVSKVLEISINGTPYYLPVIAQNT